MQLCRVIYYSLAALHVSSYVFTLHQEHLNCIYSLWYYTCISLPVGIVGVLELSDDTNRQRHTYVILVAVNTVHLYDETDLVTTVRITRLRWAGHIVRMQDNLPCKKSTLDKLEGRRRVGRPSLRWSDEGCREDGSQKLEEQGQG